jgi:hypothetical protein
MRFRPSCCSSDFFKVSAAIVDSVFFYFFFSKAADVFQSDAARFGEQKSGSGSFETTNGKLRIFELRRPEALQSDISKRDLFLCCTPFEKEEGGGWPILRISFSFNKKLKGRDPQPPPSSKSTL